MRSSLPVLLMLSTIIGGGFSQSLPIDSALSSPPDISLIVRTRGGQTVFHIGEVIPLELSFTSSARKAYQLDMAAYDRSGRLNAEEFAIHPETGWDDPLSLYFRAYGGFIGGGLRGFETLSDQPTRVSEEMNEWVRFREPGTYRVKVTSSRVSGIADQPAFRSTGVTSNELVLTIVPATQEWQHETLRRALSVLHKENDGKPALAGPLDPRHQALKTLRYLGTEEAAREMARRLNDPVCASDCMFGLIGSPVRDAALDAMNRLLHDPDYGVTPQFLGAMSVLALPESVSEDIPAQRQQAEMKFRQELISALSAKRGAGLAASVNTIVEDAAVRSLELPTDLKRSMTAQLIANFDQLPVNKQAELLQYRWKALDHQAMLPLLKKVAERYQDFSMLREVNAWNFNNSSAAALEHWYEVDPDGARPAILREILRPRPRFDARVLGILPDKELPGAEQALAQHLGESENLDATGNLASLIHRYASAAVEAPVTVYLDARLGKLACAVQEPLLAYLLKVDPAGARPRLVEATERSGEGFTACNRSLLREVAKLQNDPMLQDLAIQALDNPDPQVVQDAAAYLGEYGSAAAEPVLWSHLVTWSQRWTGREAVLLYIPGEKMDGVYEGGAGTNMLQALASGQGWLADEAKLRRLVELAVGPQQKQQAEGYLKLWQTRPWLIQFIAFERGQFQIAQYHAKSVALAKEKLLQFPAGTVFQWSGDSKQDGEEAAFKDLSEFATRHGISIAKDNQDARR